MGSAPEVRDLRFSPQGSIFKLTVGSPVVLCPVLSEVGQIPQVNCVAWSLLPWLKGCSDLHRLLVTIV